MAASKFYAAISTEVMCEVSTGGLQNEQAKCPYNHVIKKEWKTILHNNFMSWQE